MTLRVKFISQPVSALLASPNVVTVLDFSPGGAEAARDRDPRHVVTGVRALGGAGIREVWLASSPLSWGRQGDVCWTKGDFGLFVATAADSSSGPMDIVAHAVWDRLLTACADQGCPNVVRSWNHVPPHQPRGRGL